MTPGKASMSESGQKAKYSQRADVFRFAPESGLNSDIAGGPVRATTGLVQCSKRPIISLVQAALILREPIGRCLSGCYDPKAAKQALLYKVDKSNVRFMKCIVSQRCSSLSRFFA